MNVKLVTNYWTKSERKNSKCKYRLNIKVMQSVCNSIVLLFILQKMSNSQTCVYTSTAILHNIIFFVMLKNYIFSLHYFFIWYIIGIYIINNNNFLNNSILNIMSDRTYIVLKHIEKCPIQKIFESYEKLNFNILNSNICKLKKIIER